MAAGVGNDESLFGNRKKIRIKSRNKADHELLG